MDNKVVLVTGAASGLGLAVATGFARLGASVRVLARNDIRAAQAADKVRAGVSGAWVNPAVCDLASLSGLHKFVADFIDQEQRLDVLVNNAGVMPDERKHTADGVELTFATHVLAPWVLIEGLEPLDLLTFPWVGFHAARPGSGGHRPPRVSRAMAIRASGL
jgi:NAD(P)-dependent dehydrogenase (short-subunit alcohol dehydrogenase family)